jgi:hypothetical protein
LDSTPLWTQVIDNADVVYADDTSIDAVSKQYAGCGMDFSEKTGCFCCTFATHFSVYTVADKGVAASSADQQIVNAQAVSSKVKSDVGTNAASEIAQEKAAEKEPEKAGVASKLGDMAEKAGVGGIIGGVVATLLLIAAIAAVVVHKKRKQRLRAQSAGGSVFEIAARGTENPIAGGSDTVRGSVNPNWAHSRPAAAKSALHLAHGADSSRALDLAGPGSESRVTFHSKGRTFNDGGDDEPAQTTSGFNLDAIEDRASEMAITTNDDGTSEWSDDIDRTSRITLHKQRSTEEV